MKNVFSRSVALAMLLWGVTASGAAATNYIAVDVLAVNDDEILMESTEWISDAGCTVTDSAGVEHTVEGAKAVCALNSASQSGGVPLDLSSSSYGLFLNGVGDASSDYNRLWFWSFFLNGEMAWQGVADQEVSDGDSIVLTYGYWDPVNSPLSPLTLELSDTQVVTDQFVTGTVMKNDGSGYVPAEGATVFVNDWQYTTDENGEMEFGVPTAAVKEIHAELEGYTRTPAQTVHIYKSHAKKKKLSARARTKMGRRGLNSLVADGGVQSLSASPSLRDWAVMALSADGRSEQSLVEGARSYNARATGYSTEVSRNVLALSAAGKMKKARKKTKQLVQLQDPCTDAFVNDEIYAVLALRSASAKKRKTAVKRNARCAMNAQKRRGGVPLSTEGAADIDTTAAFVQMLSSIEKPRAVGLKKGRVKRARKRALKYLRRHQNPDGGWGYQPGATSNSSSTAYALMAFQSADKNAVRVRTNKRNGFNYLKRTQRRSGAFRYDVYGSSSLEELNTTSASMSLLGKWLPVNRAQ